jgi:hypothetical protein
MTLTKFKIAELPQLGQVACPAREITVQSSQNTDSARGIISMFALPLVMPESAPRIWSHASVPGLRSTPNPGLAHLVDPPCGGLAGTVILVTVIFLI